MGTGLSIPDETGCRADTYLEVCGQGRVDPHFKLCKSCSHGKIADNVCCDQTYNDYKKSWSDQVKGAWQPLVEYVKNLGNQTCADISGDYSYTNADGSQSGTTTLPQYGCSGRNGEWTYVVTGKTVRMS